MAGLAYILDNLTEWDAKRYAENKVRVLAFTCPAEQFKLWEGMYFDAYCTTETVYGVVQVSKAQRVATWKKSLPGCQIYRLGVVHHKLLHKACKANDVAYNLASEKQFTRECFEEYLKFIEDTQ